VKTKASESHLLTEMFVIFVVRFIFITEVRDVR